MFSEVTTLKGRSKLSNLSFCNTPCTLLQVALGTGLPIPEHSKLTFWPEKKKKNMLNVILRGIYLCKLE